MKIAIISDTHSKHKQLTNLPNADMIIHCGDFTSMGREHEIVNFFNWYSNLSQYKYKLIIAGNHDWLFETNPSLAKSLIPPNVTYLEDDGIEIDGLYFYGTPVSKPFCNWAFNRHPDKLIEHWKAIPENTDVLITHSPAHTILDLVSWGNTNEGSPTLRMEIQNRIKCLVHASGHIHEGNGVQVINETTHINASVLNRNYELVFEAYLIEINEGKVDVISVDRPYKSLFDE